MVWQTPLEVNPKVIVSIFLAKRLFVLFRYPPLPPVSFRVKW